MRHLGIAHLTCAVALIASACGSGDSFGEEPDAPLIVERPAAATGTPVDLDRPYEESGFFPFDSWPQGCDLITDDELRTVLPQVEAIERESRDIEMELLGIGRKATARGATCVLRVDIPAAGLPAESDQPTPPTINVAVTNAGSPTVVDSNFLTPDDDAVDLPGGECYASSVDTEVSCRVDALSFSVSVVFHDQQRADRWRNRYTVDGETTTFTSSNGDDAGLEHMEFVRDTIVARLAEVVLAKLPPRSAITPAAG